VSNYRTVSVITSFSKIYEMVMETRILKHHTKYNILSTENYGFRLRLKTDNAIHKLTTEISNSMNKWLLVGRILCDLEKEFDCVYHCILLSKLIGFGIQVRNLELYKFCLHDRYIRTAIYTDSDKSGIFSIWGRIRHGVHKALVFSINK